MSKIVEIVRSLVRPFIAFSFIITTVGLFAFGKINAQEILQTTGIIIGFYFGERAALKKPNQS